MLPRQQIDFNLLAVHDEVEMMTMFMVMMGLTAQAGDVSSVTAIDSTLDAFTQGAAVRDVERVRGALHPSAHQYVQMPDGLQVIETDAYLELLKAGKIGGVPTTRLVSGVQITGRRAVAHQIRQTEALSLHDTVSLVQQDDQWVIVSVVVEVEPAS